MVGDLILGKLDPDVACAIALEIVECPRVGVCLEGVTLYNERLERIAVERDWLLPDDELHQATRDYLVARRAMHRAAPRPGDYGSWAAATAARTRQQAITQALEARLKARLLLIERGIISTARKSGMTVRD